MRASRLIGSGFESPAEAVRWHLAMQSQDYGPAKWSIGQRSTGLTDGDVDVALATGAIVRTHVLRPTWHFVAREDIRWLLALSGPRVQQGNGPRYRELGLDERTRARCEKVIASALEGGNRLTRDGIAAVLDRARIGRDAQRMPYILMHCELEAVICSGGLSGKQQTYALMDERAPAGPRFDRDDALVELARRYLTSHGPATVKDFRWWSGLTVAEIRRALEMLGSEVRSEAIDGLTFWSLASDTVRPPAPRGAHLLQPYDELIVGYTESRFFGDPRAAPALATWRGRGPPRGIMLLNGRVAGHWRRTIERDSMRVDTLLYDGSERGVGRALEATALDLGRFLGSRVTLGVTSL
jgi:hypothetical protein